MSPIDNDASGVVVAVVAAAVRAIAGARRRVANDGEIPQQHDIETAKRHGTHRLEQVFFFKIKDRSNKQTTTTTMMMMKKMINRQGARSTATGKRRRVVTIERRRREQHDEQRQRLDVRVDRATVERNVDDERQQRVQQRGAQSTLLQHR